MKHIFIFLLLSIFISCGSFKKYLPFSSRQEPAKIALADSVQLIVQSTNLSEDMSTLSSNDDELVIFIYNYSDSTITSKPIFSSYFILNKNKMCDTIHYADKINEQNNNIIFFLLEMDSDKKLEEIEPSVSNHYKELIAVYNKKDYTEIEKHIGDDDLLGMMRIENLKSNRPLTFEFNDIYKMDRFSYSITLK